MEDLNDTRYSIFDLAQLVSSCAYAGEQDINFCSSKTSYVIIYADKEDFKGNSIINDILFKESS